MMNFQVTYLADYHLCKIFYFYLLRIKKVISTYSGQTTGNLYYNVEFKILNTLSLA